MKLWKLFPIRGPGGEAIGPWSAIYDCADGFVVMARTEAAARVLASMEAGDEGGGAWCDPELSSCLELLPHDGHPCVVLKSFHAG